MSVDKHTLQQWIAGAELRVVKTRRPFSKVPLLNRVKPLARHERAGVLQEKIDLTRAKKFRVQDAAEDILVASVELPLLGKRGVGNDAGLAVASFDYTDSEGDTHSIIAVCAYEISGAVRKRRGLKRVLIIPMA